MASNPLRKMVLNISAILTCFWVEPVARLESQRGKGKREKRREISEQYIP